MPSGTDRRRPAGRRRLAVTVTIPDGGTMSSRGLAKWLMDAAPSNASGEVVVALVSDGRMRALNRSFRGRNYATDVLSFPASARSETAAPIPGDFLGDIVIATGVARRQASQAGHTVSTELRVLALHGLLHLLGYDHDADHGAMAHLERRLRKKAGLREGLIDRGRQRSSRSSHSRGRRSTAGPEPR